MSTFNTIQGQVEALYVGYFMRAGDPAGEQYWENNLNSGTSWLTAAASFSVQLEAQNDYPFLATDGVTNVAAIQSFINAVYTDLFNRTADSAGLAYWTAYLQASAGNPTKIGTFILNVISGATTGGADDLTLQAKVAVASFITNTANAGGLTWSASVQAEATSLVAGTTSSNVAAEEAAWTAYLNLAGPPAHTFTLTVNQDAYTTGSGNDLYVAPLAGIFGNQSTLTPFDTLIDNGTNNTLNAFFAGSATVGGLTIQGIQTWNFSDAAGGSTLHIAGSANLGGPGPKGAANGNPGVTTVTLKNSVGTTLELGGTGFGGGGAGTGLQSILTNINMLNNVFTNTVSIFESAALFAAYNTAGGALTATVLNAASGTATVDAGPDTGTTGYATWNLASNGGSTVTNTIFLGATTATNAKTLNLADDGASTFLEASTTDLSSAANWANLTSISGAGTTGTVTITGAEIGGGHGFLSAKTGGALAITLGSGAGNTVDLTSYTSSAANLNLNLGTGAGNNLHINSGLADTTVAFGGFAGVANLFDATTAAGALGGTVNMTFFPGVTSLTLEDAGGGSSPALTANLIVENIANVAAAGGFVINLQSTNLGAFNEGFVGAAGGTLTVNDNGTAGGTGTFTVGAFTTLDLNVTSTTSLGLTQFTLVGPVGSTATETLNIAEALGVGVTLGKTVITPLLVGHDTVTVLSGALFSPAPGTINETGGTTTTLDLGVTNALNINVSGTLVMFGPDDSFTYAGANHVGDDVIAGGANSFLAGTLGPLTAVLVNGQNGWTGATSGPNLLVTQDLLSDTAGNTSFTGDGGGDGITVGGGGNQIVFGEFFAGGGHNLVMTDNTDSAYNGFWNVSGAGVAAGPTFIAHNLATSADNTTVTGFTVAGASPDGLFFNVDSWTAGAAGEGGLVAGGGTAVSASLGTVLQVLTNPGDQIAAATNVVMYDLAQGPLGGAAGLQAALEATPTAIKSGGTTLGEHMLFVYNNMGNLQLADVDFQQTLAAGALTSTAAGFIAVSDIVNLGSTVSLTALASHSADIHFFAVAG